MPNFYSKFLICFYLVSSACGLKSIEEDFAKNGVHTLNAGWVCAFAIPISDDEVILVDTGGEDDATSTLAGLKTLGYESDDVSHVFITHGHSDHIKGHHLFENAILVGFEEDEGLIEEKLHEKVTFDLPLKDGQQVDIGGVVVEAFHVPGHTLGNATYLINKVMLMGDTAMGNDDGTLGEPPVFLSKDNHAVKEGIKDLWERIKNRSDDVEWLFFAHTGAHQGVESLKAYSEK